MLPLPALLSCGLALIVREDLWAVRMMSSRTGRAVPGTPAHSLMFLVALLAVLYFGSRHPSARYFLASRHVRRPVSDEEAGCALGLLRFMVLAVLYWLAVHLWRM
jgi:hypothetical protein